MQITINLGFKGQCEAAFKLYEQCLGAEPGPIFRYVGSPMANDVPADWQDKIMHGSVKLGDLVLMGGDVAPEQYEEPKGFALSIQITSIDDAERVFRELARDGRIVMPLEENILGRALRPAC